MENEQNEDSNLIFRLITDEGLLNSVGVLQDEGRMKGDLVFPLKYNLCDIYDEYLRDMA